MPRQIDLRPQNLKVTNDPNNQLGFTQEQIVKLQSQIPAALEKAELTFINSVLAAIDQATGLDLEKFTQDALTHITYTGHLAEDLWNYYVGTNTTANNGTAWVTRVLDDLLITSDVFHVTYQAGSPGDAPGTLGTNGKPTWYSAWNDLLNLSGVVHSTTAPTDPAPTIGTAITTNTNWLQQFLQYELVLADVFHIVYEAGSPSDTPTTLGTNGKPTWYSAWNGLKALFGTAHSVSTPTDPAPALASAISAASTATIGGVTDTVENHLQAITDGVNQGINGGTAVGAATTSIASSLQSQPVANIVPNFSGATAVSLDTAGVGASATNASSCSATHTVAATADLLIVDVLIVGSSTINISVSCGSQPMALVFHGDAGLSGKLYRYKLINPPSGSQTVSVTVNAAVPVIVVETTSLIGAGNVGIGSASGVGSTTVTTTGISATQFALSATIASNTTSTSPALSGYSQTLLKNSGAISSGSNEGALLTGYELGGSNPGFSFTVDSSNDLRTSVLVVSPAATGPVGSGLLQGRTSATTVSGSNGLSTAYTFPSAFFNGNQTITPDLTYTTGTNTVTVSVAGWYMVAVRSLMTLSASLAMVTISPILFKNGTLTGHGNGLGAAFNVVGAQDCTSAFGGSFIVYCNVGDTLAPGYWIDGAGTASSLSLYGESTGTATYFNVSLINKSLL